MITHPHATPFQAAGYPVLSLSKARLWGSREGVSRIDYPVLSYSKRDIRTWLPRSEGFQKGVSGFWNLVKNRALEARLVSIIVIFNFCPIWLAFLDFVVNYNENRYDLFIAICLWCSSD
jgi:hypothetical protein